jgi:hypothetical protein
MSNGWRHTACRGDIVNLCKTVSGKLKIKDNYNQRALGTDKI